MQFRSSFKTVKFLFAWYFDGTSGCDTVKRTKLTEILDSFLREDKICIIRILLINTTLDINSSSKTSNFFDTRWWSKWMHLQHIPWKSSTDSLRQSQKQPCDWWALLCSISISRRSVCIYAEDTDLINDSAEKKKRQ